jgi:hypothetical protein
MFKNFNGNIKKHTKKNSTECKFYVHVEGFKMGEEEED